MNWEVFNEFRDPYMQRPLGQGIFLAGVVFGVIARGQAGSEQNIKNAPLFKQIEFGRLDKTGLQRRLARVPMLLAHYADEINQAFGPPRDNYFVVNMLSRLVNQANKLLLMEEYTTLGVDGNFVFSVAFSNAGEYFWKFVARKETEGE